MQCQSLLVQYKQQDNPLLSMNYKIIGAHKKCKKWPRLLLRPKTNQSNHTCHQKPNPSRQTVPLKWTASQIIFSLFWVSRSLKNLDSFLLSSVQCVEEQFFAKFRSPSLVQSVKMHACNNFTMQLQCRVCFHNIFRIIARYQEADSATTFI